VQARSHLLHLREGYLETQGRGDVLADLVRQSSAPLTALLRNVARLEGETAPDAEAAARAVERELGVPDRSFGAVVRLSPESRLSSDEARRLFPGYLDAVERLVAHVDRWSAA
jgi:plasmid stability protein